MSATTSGQEAFAMSDLEAILALPYPPAPAPPAPTPPVPVKKFQRGGGGCSTKL